MLDDFMVRASLAGIGVALAAAPLGCFVVWRRMAYFGEATAHAALLGISLSLLFEFSVFAGALLVSLSMASLVTLGQSRSLFLDTLLGVAGHMSIAAGLIIVSFISGVRIELMAYLIGDILAVSKTDILLIWLGLGLVLLLLIWRWSALLLCTLNEDLAAASGLNPKRESFVLTIALAVVVAVGIKVVGVLLIISMLIIPAASARSLGSTPEKMALFACLIGVSSAILGLNASYVFDTPTGPSIVSVASLIFISTLIFTFLKDRFLKNINNKNRDSNHG
ncbi:MAG: metal ABC transporter permease [Paracoccaceae bacterium]